MRGEEQEWAERIEWARKRLRREAEEASSWTPVIEEARRRSERRPEVETADWADAIARAKRRAEGTRAAGARVCSAASESESAQWQAAIRRAKQGHG